MVEKRLFRSRTDRMIWGVCGGLAKYFNIDPVLVRLIFVVTIFFGGLGILAYIILAIVVPLETSASTEPRETIRENVQEMKQTAVDMGKDIQSTFSKTTEPRQAESRTSNNALTPIGIVVIVIGIIFLLMNVGAFFWFSWWGWIWPAILIIIGILIIFARRK